MDADDAVVAVPPEEVARRRRMRTWISAALLAAGSAAFVVSLALPAVRKVLDPSDPPDGRLAAFGGWICATHHGPTAGTNWFLVLSVAVWIAAVHWRSIWAWYLGVLGGVVAVLLHGFVGAWPGYERIVALLPGYWTWLGASAAVCASFLVLPRPVRTEPGERLPVADRDRGRRALATVLGSLATLALLAAFFAVPTPVGRDWVQGVPEKFSEGNWYEVGPIETTTTPGARTIRADRADGTQSEIAEYAVERGGPVVVVLAREPGTALFAFASLCLAPLFLAAVTSRRRWWRLTGAVTAAATLVAVIAAVEAPWPKSGFSPHPLDVLWTATPAVFMSAFALLPPQRGEGRSSLSTSLRHGSAPPEEVAVGS